MIWDPSVMSNNISIFLVICAAVSLAIFLIFLTKPKDKLTKRDKELITKKLLDIKNSNESVNLKVIKVDNLLDLAYKKLGRTGSMGEKLKKMNYKKNIDDLWYIHKLRCISSNTFGTL